MSYDFQHSSIVRFRYWCLQVHVSVMTSLTNFGVNQQEFSTPPILVYEARSSSCQLSCENLHNLRSKESHVFRTSPQSLVSRMFLAFDKDSSASCMSAAWVSSLSDFGIWKNIPPSLPAIYLMPIISATTTDAAVTFTFMVETQKPLCMQVNHTTGIPATSIYPTVTDLRSALPAAKSASL